MALYRYYLSLLITFLSKDLEERDVEIKNRKSSFNFFFGQGKSYIRLY